MKIYFFNYLEKVNIIQVASSSILPNDEKFLNSYNKNENNNIKSIVLPRIQSPSYKNHSHNLRNSNNYGHHINININHQSEMQSNFNNKCLIQKNTR